MNYHIITFGCAANEVDSERIAAYYAARGYTNSKLPQNADVIIINTCMIRQKAEDRVYGWLHNLEKLKQKNKQLKIVLTGCMVGMAVREKTGVMLSALKKKMPSVDEFLQIEEIGFELTPLRTDKTHATVTISNGCNNFCTYCVVPYTRGREVSRPFHEIITECKQLAIHGYTYVTLVGQNVNSYGADIVKGQKAKSKGRIKKSNEQKITYVKHLGRLRIPTLFPFLLEELCKIDGIQKISFLSSNPWDFSDDLIKVIAENPKISRQIHLPVQSGDNGILKKMNRWYTAGQYLRLIKKIRQAVPNVSISTDIIVGFCGETKRQFNNTVLLAKKAGFSKAYISMYSDRPMTSAHKIFRDDIPYQEKKRRWEVLDEVINKTNLRNGTYK